MRLYKLAERALTAPEEKTIAHFRYYYDCKKCFALIGEYVVAVLPDECSGSVEKLERKARENLSALLHTPPDFSTYIMDDAFGLLEMAYGVYAVSPERLSEEERAAGRVDMAASLAMRSLCLEACRAGRIVAINDEELAADDAC